MSPTRLRLLTQGHQCRFSVRSPGILPSPLFTGPGARPNPPKGGPFLLSPGSRHYGSPRAYTVRRGDSRARPTPRRRRLGLRCREYPGGTRILTGFPFGGSLLGATLGPTNLWPTNVATEPWPFRRSGFSPDFAATTAGILVPAWSTRPHGRASTHAGRPPTGSPL